MKYDWQWSVYLQPAADGSGTWIQYLVVGLGWTLATALAAWVIALAIGSVVGTLRTTPMKWVVRLGNAYVEIFRNVPLLVQMFLWFFVVPELLPKGLGDAIKQMPPPWGSYRAGGAVPRPLHVGARGRAGPRRHPVAAARPGHGGHGARPHAAADLPLRAAADGFRIILPPLTSEFLNIIKNSSVALTIGLLELTGRARAMQEFSFKVFEAFSAATVIYLLTNLVIVLLMRMLERKVRVPGFIGSATQVTPGH